MEKEAAGRRAGAGDGHGHIRGRILRDSADRPCRRAGQGDGAQRCQDPGAAAGTGLQELLYYTRELLNGTEQEPIVFEQEFFPEEMTMDVQLPYTVEKSGEEEGVFIVEGPRIEKMLGYTNLDSEKGFVFFQNFLKDTGILKELEEAGIQEGDTVRMYGLAFEYFRDRKSVV